MTRAEPVVDMLADFPSPAWLTYHAQRLAHLRGYLARFHRVLARSAGVSPEVMAGWAQLAPDDAGRRLAAALIERAPSLSRWLQARRALGVVHSVVLHEDPGDQFGVEPASLVEMAHAMRSHPDELSLFAGVGANRQRSAETLELARQLGLRGVMVSPFMARLPASDRAWEPIFASCEEHGWMAWVHTSGHFWPDAPADVGHPRYLADVAARHPKLRLIAGHAGHPWVADLVTAMRSHPNILADLSTFRPAQLMEEAWRPLYEAGKADLADRVLFAGGSIGLDLGRLLEELDSLPLPAPVRRAWLYGNAARELGLPEGGR